MIKKIVLTLFFSIFVCVFVGFNYLLIQKENADIGTFELEQEMTAKSATITNQVTRIGELEGRISDLLEQIASLREQGGNKDETIANYEKETLERDELLGKREDLINKLKQGLDVELVGQQAREWIEFINNGDYDKSYARFNKAIDNSYTTMIFSEFRAYYAKQVGMVEVKSIDVMTRGIPDTIDNDLVVAVVVDLITPRSLELFYESLDERRAISQAEADAEAARRAAEAASELLDQLREAANKQNDVDRDVDNDSDSEPDDSLGLDDQSNDAGENNYKIDADADADAGASSGDNGDAVPSDENANPGGGDATTDGGNVDNAAAGNNDIVNNSAIGTNTDASNETGDDPHDGSPIETPGATPGATPEGVDEEEEVEEDPFDKDSYISASAILAAMAEYEYIYTDDLDDSVFNTGENQFIFLMNYKKEANDWEIIRIVQKL